MKSFLSACGLVDPLQLVVDRPGTEGGELRLLHQPFALIGRNPRADLVFDHAEVSRRHVYIQIIEGQAFWFDLESRTGIRANGELQKSGWLTDGQTLGVGPYMIRQFANESQTGDGRPENNMRRVTPFLAKAYSQAPLPEVALEFLDGPSQAMAWPVRRVMSFIGSASGCKFRLTDGSVSRFHASFLRTSAGLWIIDLLGEGGISVNNSPVRFSYLADEDLIRIGRYQIRLRCRPGRRGSGHGLPDRRAPRVFTEPSSSHTSDGLNSPDWGSMVASFMPGTEVANLRQLPPTLPVFAPHARSEIMPAEANYPLTGGSSVIPESMLVPLVNQFGLMQQQMLDQFQQAMAMMVQMFGTMHHEQMEAVRAELDQLRDLTEEFHALKKELANRTPEETVATAVTATFTSGRLDESMASEPNAPPSLSGEPSGLKAGQASEKLAMTSPLPPDQGVSTPVTHSSLPQSKLSVTQRPSKGLQESKVPPQAKVNDKTTPLDSEKDSVAWLHMRIVALQRERETRWQKILKLLPGMSS
jgi:pSer/pThr/pTyr-binding forkhead associated (FHA) protein